MKRLSLRMRFTLITSMVVGVCCLVIFACLMNSAVMKLDSLETGMISFSMPNEQEITMELSLADFNPEISAMIAEAKADFLKQSMLITLIVIAVGACVTYFAAAYALRPIHTLSEAVEKTTEDNLYEQLPVPEAQDEVHRLTQSINRMRTRLDKAFVSQKQFSANAAHELRTPLAIMQTNLEVFRKKNSSDLAEYRDVVSGTLQQIENMNHLVNTLLDFQSMHAQERKDHVIVAELAEEIQCDLEPLAEKKGITIRLEADEKSRQISTLCCETLLYRGIYNLVENAIKYNHEGGTVDVSISAGKGEHITILVRDSGQGIPEEQWEKIFEPFYRVDKSRSRKSGGAGLGLAMVREIAEMHQGDIRVLTSSPEGTTIRWDIGDDSYHGSEQSKR